jgi:hypothetical protein
MFRYLVYEDGELVRKFASRIECEPYLRTGCALKVLPKPKNPTPTMIMQYAHQLCGDAPF